MNNAEPIILFKALSGSRAYGTDNPDSDWDWRGCYIAPFRAYAGLDGTEDEFREETGDTVYWEIEKLLKLSLQCNPNVLEVLYSPMVEMAPFTKKRGIHFTPELIFKNRNRFLSQRAARTFGGYATAQVAKFSKSLAIRQPDWKNAAHVLRLLIMGSQLLMEGVVSVRLEGDELARVRSVRNGEVSVGTYMGMADKAEQRFADAKAKTTLPHEPDWDFANELLLNARLWSVRATPL